MRAHSSERQLLMTFPSLNQIFDFRINADAKNSDLRRL